MEGAQQNLDMVININQMAKQNGSEDKSNESDHDANEPKLNK